MLNEHKTGDIQLYENLKRFSLSHSRMRLQQPVLVAAFLLLHVISCEGLIEHIPLPEGLKECFARYSEKTSIVDTVGESIASFCYGQFMWYAAKERGLQGFNISREVSFPTDVSYTLAHIY